MFIDWILWLSSRPLDQLWQICIPLLLLDGTRYAIGASLLFAGDFARRLIGWSDPDHDRGEYEFCPSVCVVVAGLNEAASIGQTLDSLWGTYPRMEIIIVDDGSSDGMSQVARSFAATHAGVRVLRKPVRGGKSSALNFALPFAAAEIIVCVDGDSHLAENAIWEVVQPLADPAVGAVSACVLARNPFARMVTWMQAFEFLRNIFVGRMIAAKLGMLGIISGAFGAYRREALVRLQGWDVGPGEDGDMTLRLRKAGYTVEFAPYAQCFTSLPTSWRKLWRQRRRWQWAVITLECRKHVDLANPLNANFRMSNLCLLADRWLYDVALSYIAWGYMIWLCFHWHDDLWKLFLLYFVMYVISESVQAAVFLYFSNQRRRDARIALVAPLMPFYHATLRLVTLIAITEEIFTRRSYRDGFVPQRVRDATWHW